MIKFSDLNLVPELTASIEAAGFETCTPVQEETFKRTLAGKDVLVQSQTGTGKTAAFLISMFQIIETSQYRERAIIIVPTRELATQIEDEARLLSLHLHYNIVAVYGGVGYDKQIQGINDDVEILIGTPGRIIDLMEKRVLDLKKFTLAVIDEADRMFDMGFVDDLRKIFRRTPNKLTRQTMMFSATLSFSVKQLAKTHMNNPEEIEICPETITVDKITQKIFHVGKSQKVSLLLGLIKHSNASHILIFCNMKYKCEELAERLKMNGIEAGYLTGDLPQNKRQKTVDNFKEHKMPVLIATDVAARGIHIDDLDMVINYDIPQHAENYVHRIGRTARAGKSGSAITFACEEFVEFLPPVEKMIAMKIPSEVPATELFAEDASAGKNWKRRSSERGDRDRSRSGDRSKGGSRSSQSRTGGSSSNRSRGGSNDRPYKKENASGPAYPKRPRDVESPAQNTERHSDPKHEHKSTGHSDRDHVTRNISTKSPAAPHAKKQSGPKAAKPLVSKIRSFFGKK